jgi:hypothetical protein
LFSGRDQDAAVIAQLIQLGHVGHDLSDFLALPQITRWFTHLT